MNNVRLFLAALALVACSKGPVGVNPGSSPVLISDPSTSTFASVQGNGALNEVPGNSAPFFATGNFGNVKNGPGTVYGATLISRDTTHDAYLQLANNVWVEAGAQPNTAPNVEVATPPAGAATVFPSSPVVATYAPQAGLFFDAGINYCVSTSSITCTPVLDAGAYNVQVVYQ